MKEYKAPLVAVEKIKGALRIVGLDRAASHLGLRLDQPLANARAMVPELDVVVADPHADQLLLMRMADWCDRFTPFVACDGPRGLLLDITGVAHLFGGEDHLLRRIVTALRQQHLEVQAAVAGTVIAARALSRHHALIIVPEGRERDAVSPLPIDALGFDHVTTHAFRRAGLKTIGQAAARKRAEIVSRFGAGTLLMIEEAMGQCGQPVSPRLSPPDYWQEQNFAEPIALEDTIQATLLLLAEKLARVLEQHGTGARKLEAAFFRADGEMRRIAIEMGAPTRDPKIIGRLFREKLGSLADPLDPGFGFDLIRLAAHRVEAVAVEDVDLDSSEREKKEISFLVDRLATRFGRERILAFEPRDTHIPEEAWVTLPAQDAKPQEWRKGRPRPLRVFHLSQPVIPAKAGIQLQSQNSDVESKLGPGLRRGDGVMWRKSYRPIINSEGPERIACAWWRLIPTPLPLGEGVPKGRERAERSEAFDAAHAEPKSSRSALGPLPPLRAALPQRGRGEERDYFRLHSADGRSYWVYRQDDDWFLHGLFA